MPAYLFYCGLLIHFIAVAVVVTLALRSSVHPPVERLAEQLARPLENSQDCSLLFRGQRFQWEKPALFELPLTASGFQVLPYYKNLGLRGRLASGHEVFQVGFDVEIREDKGLRKIVKPHGNAYFEIDRNQRITHCHVQGGENRAFNCLLESGQIQPNQDCVIPVTNAEECTNSAGLSEGAHHCRFTAERSIPKLSARRASARSKEQKQACEKAGWFRTLACADEGRFCQVKSLCRPQAGEGS